MRLELPPLPIELMGIEARVLDAVGRVHGDKAVERVARDLARRSAYRDRTEEVDRALRTLVERETDTPLRMFRFLFRRACAGDMLCDAADDAARTLAAESAPPPANELPADFSAHDPGTHWPDWIQPPGTDPIPIFSRDMPPPAPRPKTYEDRALERARRLRLAGLDPPPPPRDAGAAARWLDSLAPELREQTAAKLGEPG